MKRFPIRWIRLILSIGCIGTVLPTLYKLFVSKELTTESPVFAKQVVTLALLLLLAIGIEIYYRKSYPSKMRTKHKELKMASPSVSTDQEALFLETSARLNLHLPSIYWIFRHLGEIDGCSIQSFSSLFSAYTIKWLLDGNISFQQEGLHFSMTFLKYPPEEDAAGWTLFQKFQDLADEHSLTASELWMLSLNDCRFFKGWADRCLESGYKNLLACGYITPDDGTKDWRNLLTPQGEAFAANLFRYQEAVSVRIRENVGGLPSIAAAFPLLTFDHKSSTQKYYKEHYGMDIVELHRSFAKFLSEISVVQFQ